MPLRFVVTEYSAHTSKPEFTHYKPRLVKTKKPIKIYHQHKESALPNYLNEQQEKIPTRDPASSGPNDQIKKDISFVLPEINGQRLYVQNHLKWLNRSHLSTEHKIVKKMGVHYIVHQENENGPNWPIVVSNEANELMLISNIIKLKAKNIDFNQLAIDSTLIKSYPNGVHLIKIPDSFSLKQALALRELLKNQAKSSDVSLDLIKVSRVSH